MKVVVVIPAYQEEKTIEEVIRRTRSLIFDVLVIDDGSRDTTSISAKRAGARVIRHSVNRGLGAALGTGFAAARLLQADVVVTLDGDLQHEPEAIPLFVEQIEKGADVVIGSRMLTGLKGMPWHRKFATHVGNVVTRLLFGVSVTDSQSGFRAFSRKALDCMELTTDRMEVSSEIIAEAGRKHLQVVEVPIRALYTLYSLSKGQGIMVGCKTLFKLVLHRLKL